MRFSYQISAAFMGAVALVQPYVALALSSSQVNEIAKPITVLTDGQFPGSGTLVRKQGNTYYVLTAKHVVNTEDKYEIVTSDGKRYPVNYRTVKKLPGVDLAVLQFTSDRTYSVANLGNSDQATEGTTVYIAGFPKPGLEIKKPIYQFTPGQISGRLQPASRDGYALVYTNITRAGMSGGPVLNDQGKVIGIHGRAEGEANNESAIGSNGKVGFNLGIPIKTFLNLAPQIGLNFNPSAAPTAPAPQSPQATASAPPALRWSFQDNRTSIDGCLEKANIVMLQDKFKNVSVSREWQYVSGIVDNYAIDISCNLNYSMIIVAGSDHNTAKLWRDRLGAAMASTNRPLPPRPSTTSSSTAAPGLRWSFRTHYMSIDDCLDKAYGIMQQEGLKNLTLNRQNNYVSGFVNNYAVDISCNPQDWIVLVTGSDKNTAGRWRDKLRDAMEE